MVICNMMASMSYIDTNSTQKKVFVKSIFIQTSKNIHPKKLCGIFFSQKPKLPLNNDVFFFFRGDFHPFFICKDLVHHPIERTILKWMFQVLDVVFFFSPQFCKKTLSDNLRLSRYIKKLFRTVRKTKQSSCKWWCSQSFHGAIFLQHHS